MKVENMLPSEKMVLDVLYMSPTVAEDVLVFYEPYILKMSTEPYYDIEGNRLGYQLNEDLAQEIRISLIKSIPKLREAIIREYFDAITDFAGTC